MSAFIDPKKFKYRNFRVESLDWNIYEVDHPEVKGILKVLAFPVYVFEVTEVAPVQPGTPNLQILYQPLISFYNAGQKVEGDTTPVTPEEYRSKRVDITDSINATSMPLCSYVLDGEPPLRLRISTTVTKVELIQGKVTQWGDPIIWVTWNANYSVTEIGDSTTTPTV